MPPKSQRSRACSQCRSRRVKCDETPETCNQCRRLGLTCSGPLQGSIVIDMTERVVKPKGRKKKETARASAPTADKAGTQPAVKKSPDDAVYAALNKAIAPLNATIQNAMFSAEPQDAEKVEKAVKAIRYYYRPPSFDQPSKALPEALDVAFLAHYVELNRNGKDYAPELQWLAYLPNLFSNVRKPAVRLSLRAASMAFYGKHHHDPSILIDSWRWYTVALGALRASIASTKKNGIPDEEEVLVPMVLAVYEIYVGAALTGSITHMRAADQIMKLRGPRNCNSRVIWPLFKTLRHSEAHKSIVYNKISVYSSPDWLTIPFIGKPKDAQQDLTDIELMIPHCTAYLGIQGSLRTVFETPTPPDVDVLPGKELACRLIKDINRWAEDYPDLAQPSIRPFRATPLGSVSDSTKENPHEPEMPREAMPLIGSHYLADRLVLNMLMYKMRTESKAPLVPHESSTEHYFSQAKEMSQAILNAAYEIEKASPGFDMLRSITPVVTVSCIAPTMQLKNEAKATLFRCASQFTGLAPVLERIMVS